VILQGPKDDKELEADKEPEAALEVTATKPKIGVQREEKPKWTITKPSYLKDYVWGRMVCVGSCDLARMMLVC